jgi:hypothetical protein
VLAKGADALEHIDELLALAKLPNVAIKATAAPAYSGRTIRSATSATAAAHLRLPTDRTASSGVPTSPA